MSLKYDLHTHSTASDGTLSPQELIMAAEQAEIDVLALTDHDTLDGLLEASQAAEQRGITLINGVEVSVTWGNQVVHIVGLDVDQENSKLSEGLQENRRFRDWRAEEIGRRLAKVGISDAYEAARLLSNGKLISRTHFARHLVQAGHAPDMNKVFKNYLTPGNPGHVKGEWAELSNAVNWINDAGGVAVLAHPARYRMTRSKLRRLLGEFSECGGVGLEVVTSSHSRDEIYTMARHARDFSFLGSCGSDFHAFDTPWAALGHFPELPPGVSPVWMDWNLEQEARLA